MRHHHESAPDGDYVLASVAAYSTDPSKYASDHGAKMSDQLERFANSLPPRSRILDAGCGPGRDLARIKAFAHEAIGVELNSDFARLAHLHAPVVLTDLRFIGKLFPSNSFDGIWACASLVHLSAVETADVLRQFKSLLTPAGKLYACVNTVGKTGWLDEADGRRWYRIWSHDEFAGVVRQSGFAIDEVRKGQFVEIWATAERKTGTP